jgi:hypothetical protein
MRLLETGTLLKLIVPMMCSSREEKGGSIVINGLKIFKNLTLIKENNEYSKLQIGVNILVNLFKVDSYYKMTNLCIIAIGNLCKQNEILEIINRKDDTMSKSKRGESGKGIFETMVSKHLEDSDSKTQAAILQMFNYLTNLQGEVMGDTLKASITNKMKKLLFEKQLLDKIVSCFVSLNKNVSTQSLSILMYAYLTQQSAKRLRQPGVHLDQHNDREAAVECFQHLQQSERRPHSEVKPFDQSHRDVFQKTAGEALRAQRDAR